MVLQAKAAGNPFYMREMLNACYRKKCIWYDYQGSAWRYDINRVFEQFQGDSDYDLLNTDFITSHLKELPPASRSVLGWAALIGGSFSFELICHLLSGEFIFFDDSCPGPASEHVHVAYSQEDAISGLQAAIQACVITPTETDDMFRFAHDRYVMAAMDLKVCNKAKMHYCIARTIMQYYSNDPQMLDNAAAHICESVAVLRDRVVQRLPYRQVLYECGRVATENGARPTASKYYNNAITLLQDEPWQDDGVDAHYDETLQLYQWSAECHLYVGQQAVAHRMLESIFRCAKSPLDKAPAWVTQSRIFAQTGKCDEALSCLEACLKDIGIPILVNPTYERCDSDFKKLATRIQSMDRVDVQNPPSSKNTVFAAAGAVLAEATSISLWGNGPKFYHLSTVLVDMHLNTGAIPQSGLGFLYLAMISISRFSMIRYGSDLSTSGLELLDRFRDPFTMARGYMIYGSFLGHLQYPLASTVVQLEESLEYGASTGDRVSAILGFGLAAQMRFFASEVCTDLEAFCQYSCEEIPNWHRDPQGGVLLLAVRQVCRALQGKTHVSNAFEVMSDGHHRSAEYRAWLRGMAPGPDQSQLFYDTMELVPLYLYGHYERVVELGGECLQRSALILSARNTRLAMLLHGLALAGLELRRRQDPRLLANSNANNNHNNADHGQCEVPDNSAPTAATIAKLK